MQLEIWNPEIKNHQLYNGWSNAFGRLCPHGYEFYSFVKRSRAGKGLYFVLAYSPNRQEYYDSWRRDHSSSFAEDDIGIATIQTKQTYGDYILKANKHPFIPGAMLSVHKEQVSMDKMDERATRDNFRIWSKMARDLGVIVVKNYGDSGASISNREHAHVFAVHVPLEFFLAKIENDTMVGYPGRNLVCHYSGIDNVVAEVFRLRERGVSPNPFMFGDMVGYIERRVSEEATKYFGDTRASGVTLLGIGEAGNKERFDQLKTASFKEIWENIEKVLVPKD